MNRLTFPFQFPSSILAVYNVLALREAEYEPYIRLAKCLGALLLANATGLTGFGFYAYSFDFWLIQLTVIVQEIGQLFQEYDRLLLLRSLSNLLSRMSI